jgi:ribonuclease HI
VVTTVYTDGACQGNPGPGGWAWAVPGGAYRSGAEAHTTNQRMELQAVLDAVTALEDHVEVVSDSTYVVNCFKNRWWEGWERRAWKNSQRQDVANQDLWRPLIDAYKRDPARLEFRWVKGHSADPMNDLVDRLAVEAAARQEGRSGSGTPDRLGPADRPGPVSARAAGSASTGPSATRSTATGSTATGSTVTGSTATGSTATGSAATGPSAPGTAATATAATGSGGTAPSVIGSAAAGSGGTAPAVTGHRVIVTGLRPPGLGGYDENLTAAAVRRRLGEILAAKAALHPDLVVMTGLGLGAEQLGAEAAAEAKVPYVAVLAFPDQDGAWPAGSRARFGLLVDGAAEALVLEGRAPRDRQDAGRLLARRDTWLEANADEAVVVWDLVDADVGRAVRSLRHRLGEEQVWVLEP